MERWGIQRVDPYLDLAGGWGGLKTGELRSIFQRKETGVNLTK